jgi:2-amino-4-hydroxy-6-hydroxymethyldihydropteridine diphosphokinase
VGADNGNECATCYVGLGSNLGDSTAYLNKAIDALQSSDHIHALKISPFYRSKPHGPQDQPDYLNAVAGFNTGLQAGKLLDLLQTIEADNERVREGVVRWGARTLDLDLLFFGDQVITTKRLTVPHPHICERAFVLLPLADLLGDSCKDLKISPKTTIKDCIDRLSDDERANTVKLTGKNTWQNVSP